MRFESGLGLGTRTVLHPNQKQIRPQVQLDAFVTRLWADERRLKQMLVNLLSNAVKFTPSGGHVGLEVIGDAAHEEVRFTVWDTGVGISAENIARLFQPFVQVDGGLARKYEGTGLGLALTRRLAEMHGGGVSAEISKNNCPNSSFRTGGNRGSCTAASTACAACAWWTRRACGCSFRR